MQYQVQVVLRDVSPAVWRTLDVPGNLTLHTLHRALQIGMGWGNAHLYLFHVGEQVYGYPSVEWEMPVANAVRTKLDRIAATTSRFTYEYDLGDRWLHELTLEPAQAGTGPAPVQCTGGAGACPPEDCGGAIGYSMFLEALADPLHEDHEAMQEWIGGSFDPNAFDLAAVNRALRSLLLGRRS